MKIKFPKPKILRDFFGFLLDLIFPIQCLGCGNKNSYLCKKCLENISPPAVEFCPVCEKAVTDSGKLCSLCQKENHPLNQLIVAANYQNELLSRSVHFFKYRFVRSLGTPLGEVLTKAIQKSHLAIPDFIIPIPLHSFRQRWRGFNQAEILCKEISLLLIPGIEIPVISDLVVRQKFTRPQMKISGYHQRQQNIAGAFNLNHYSKWLTEIKGKRILIVDDICTTGATLFEVARVIKKLQPKSIVGAVLARQKN